METIAGVLTEYKKKTDRIQKICILSVNVKEKLSEFVRRRIKELGLKNADVARLAGLSRSYIGNIVNETAPTQSGQYNLSPEAVAALAKALQVSPSEILESMNYLSSSPGDLVAIGFKELSDEDKDKVRTFIEFLKSQKKT